MLSGFITGYLMALRPKNKMTITLNHLSCETFLTYSITFISSTLYISSMFCLCEDTKDRHLEKNMK